MRASWLSLSIPQLLPFAVSQLQNPLMNSERPRNPKLASWWKRLPIIFDGVYPPLSQLINILLPFTDTGACS